MKHYLEYFVIDKLTSSTDIVNLVLSFCLLQTGYRSEATVLDEKRRDEKVSLVFKETASDRAHCPYNNFSFSKQSNLIKSVFGMLKLS